MESEVREQVDTNCFGFVYHRLGLIPKEKYISPVDIHLNNYFEETKNPAKADAVAVIPKSDYGIDVPPQHLALVDPKHPSRVIDRPSPYDEEGKRGIESVMAEYNDPNLRLAFLKLKKEASELIPA